MTKPKHTKKRRKRANGAAAATPKPRRQRANGFAAATRTASPRFPHVPAVAIAELLGVSVRRVGQLSREGIIPTGPEFDPVECVRGYVQFWKRKAYGGEPDQGVQRARLLALRVERGELAVARIRRTQIPVDQLDRVWSGVLRGFRNNVLAVEQQAPRWLDCETEPELREALRDWAHALLDTLSERMVYGPEPEPAQAPTPKGVKP